MPQMSEMITKVQIDGKEGSQVFVQKLHKVNPQIKVIIKPSQMKIKVKVKK